MVTTTYSYLRNNLLISDRVPATPPVVNLISNIAPHATTTRATITVADGYSLVIHSLQIGIKRRTAAGTAASAEIRLYKATGTSAGLTICQLRLESEDNSPGDMLEMVLPGPIVIPKTGNSDFILHTFDLSTGGIVRYQAHIVCSFLEDLL